MHELWPQVARRMVEGLGVQPGDLVQVRGELASYEALLELLLAVELAGGTPLPEITPQAYLNRLWSEATTDILAQWDARRAQLLGLVDRVLTIQRPDAEISAAPGAGQAAWRSAVGRLVAVQDARRLPFLVAAAPGAAWAVRLGLSFSELEARLLPALAAPAAELRAEIGRTLAAAGASQGLTLRTGEGCELRLDRRGRPWLDDDGYIDEHDRARGALVSNLPAGSIYTTVREDAVEGTLWLAVAGPALDVKLRFATGRIVDIQACSGGSALAAWLDSHSGEPRRISHIGVGLNPYLRARLGWTMVDEHVHGAIFLALGDNQYLGGENSSSLNVDFALHGATLLADQTPLVAAGRLLV